MRFKTTLIIFVVFIALLSFVLLFESNQAKKDRDLEKIFNLAEENIAKISIEGGEKNFLFEKNSAGVWMITAPLETQADQVEISDLAREIGNLKYVRIVDEAPTDMEKFGIPQKQISIFSDSEAQPEKIWIGQENPLDNTLFARKESEQRVVLLPNTFKALLEKNLYDFRNKTIFQLETQEVRSVASRSDSLSWKASKIQEEWFLEEPLSSLADSGHMDNLIRSLSNLRAQEFVSENKTETMMDKFGLNKPDFTITLNLPGLEKQAEILIHAMDDLVYAASSTTSKIVRVENSIIDLLDKQLDNLRDRKPGGFYLWEVNKVQVEQNGIQIIATKNEEGLWEVDGSDETSVNREKIDRFIRHFETSEATAMIDPPLDLKEYGLDPPQSEIIFWTGNGTDHEDKVILFIGKRDEDIEQIYVKNNRFDYLFRINAGFMKDLPNSLSDWLSETGSD